MNKKFHKGLQKFAGQTKRKIRAVLRSPEQIAGRLSRMIVREAKRLVNTHSRNEALLVKGKTETGVSYFGTIKQTKETVSWGGKINAIVIVSITFLKDAKHALEQNLIEAILVPIN